jgi:hypothetical protein
MKSKDLNLDYKELYEKKIEECDHLKGKIIKLVKQGEKLKEENEAVLGCVRGDYCRECKYGVLQSETPYGIKCYCAFRCRNFEPKPKDAQRIDDLL